MSAARTETLKRNSALVARFGERENDSEQRQESLLGQEAFTRALRLERRRSERSGRPFLLILLDGGSLLATNGTGSVRAGLSAILHAQSRDTDVIGWYQNNSVMAMLCTEICDPPENAVEVVNSRLHEAIQRQLLPQQAEKIRISVHVYPEGESGSDGPGNLTLYPDLQRRLAEKKVVHSVKRAIDIAGSLMALVVLSPVFLAIALAIKLTSKGPILFRQRRIGHYAQPFTFLKFRSMYANNDPKIHQEYVSKFIAGDRHTKNADAKGNGVFKITDDPRVTPVGRILRRTSLDEFPQLINVLLGDMSLVGPRPPVPYEVEKYDIWHRRRLFEAKPGITGLWQVNGRSRLSFDEMVRLDLEYVERSSLLLDFEILLRTPRAVFSGDGAY
jgi:lipopolysaccharide/colanic/teichoic acid biosynthesis glycosyltransferase